MLFGGSSKIRVNKEEEEEDSADEDEEFCSHFDLLNPDKGPSCAERQKKKRRKQLEAQKQKLQRLSKIKRLGGGTKKTTQSISNKEDKKDDSTNLECGEEYFATTDFTNADDSGRLTTE